MPVFVFGSPERLGPGVARPVTPQNRAREHPAQRAVTVLHGGEQRYAVMSRPRDWQRGQSTEGSRRTLTLARVHRGPRRGRACRASQAPPVRAAGARGGDRGDSDAGRAEALPGECGSLELPRWVRLPL